jgi:spore coat polysaccharide biosynthesis predicted glycosyltransferase SpsG
MQSQSSIIDDNTQINAYIIIYDRHDKSLSYMNDIKKTGVKIINFEDLGEGAKEADLTINAIYPEDDVIPGHYFGHQYFVLRDEFMITKMFAPKKEVQEVLLTFGGVDPNDFTCKVLKAIYSEAVKRKIKISIVAGFGYNQFDNLEKFDKAAIHKNVQNISDYMERADIIFTSAGRTTYEIAATQTPAIVLAQNERELTHFFANAEHGFINLGLGADVTSEKILHTFINLVESYEQRQYMSQLMSECDMTKGRKKVIRLIHQVINT